MATEPLEYKAKYSELQENQSRQLLAILAFSSLSSDVSIENHLELLRTTEVLMQESIDSSIFEWLVTHMTTFEICEWIVDQEKGTNEIRS